MSMLMTAIKIQESVETELKECDGNVEYKGKSQGQGYDLAFGFHAQEKEQLFIEYGMIGKKGTKTKFYWAPFQYEITPCIS